MWHLYFYREKTTRRNLLETPCGILCKHVVIVLLEKRSYWQILQAWKENYKVFAFHSSYKKRSKTCFLQYFRLLKVLVVFVAPFTSKSIGGPFQRFSLLSSERSEMIHFTQLFFPSFFILRYLCPKINYKIQLFIFLRRHSLWFMQKQQTLLCQARSHCSNQSHR